jgi:hypothetical protein
VIDPFIAVQLEASRAHWIERDVDRGWREWLAETSSRAFRGLAPELLATRIHSLPGTHWEVLRDAAGAPTLIVDDETTASLAELRALSSAGASQDGGYDRAILILADGFRACRDDARFLACMRWAIAREEPIHAMRRAALAQAAFSAESMVVLLHELAHHVSLGGDPALARWREMSRVAVDKLIAALTDGTMREGLIAKGVEFGLEAAEAELQVAAYIARLRTRETIREELLCDLLAAVGFVNQESEADAIREAGPTALTTRQVGDAFYVAHGAIQNIQFLNAASDIAERIAAGECGSFDLAAVTMELQARSSGLVVLLSNLLRAWCTNGTFTDPLADAIRGGNPAFVRSVEARNAIRSGTLLVPLEELDGILLDEERFLEFDRQGRERMREAGLDESMDLDEMQTARWRLTLARAL